MKILLSKDEIRQIVLDHLASKGHITKVGTYTHITHTEGEYDSATQVFDGVSVEIDSRT